MGWLVGLPLGLFRLLGSILLVALRFAVPILILVAVILVVRHVRRRSARYRAEDEDRQEPKGRIHRPRTGSHSPCRQKYWRSYR